MIARLPNGQAIQAYVARPSVPGPGVLVLHSAWGLLRDYRDVCDQLADAGFVAVAPDLFDGRTATTLADAERLAMERPSISLMPTVELSIQWLESQPELDPKRVALLGFSLGGATALRVAADGLGTAVVTYYGTPGPDHVADGIRVPVLGHFAESDPYEPAANVCAMFDTLQRQGISATMLTYPGTGHCFFEPSLETYDQPSAVNSWNRTLVFLRENLVRIAPILLLLVVAGCGSPKTAPPAPSAPTPPNLLYQTRDGVRDGLTQWMNEPGAEPEAKLTALFNLKDLRRQGPVQWQAADLDGNGTTEYVLAFPVNNPSSTGDSLGQGAALFVIYRKDGRWEVDRTDPMPDRVEVMLMPPSLYAVADVAGTGRPQIISVRPHAIATGPQPFSVFVTAWAPGAFTLLPGQMVISNGPKEQMTVTLDGKDVVLTGGSRSHDLMPPRIDRYHFIDGAFKLVDRRFQNPCDFCTLPPKDDFLEGLN